MSSTSYILFIIALGIKKYVDDINGIILSRLHYGNSSCMKRAGPGDMRHGDTISLPDSVIDTSRPVKLKDFAEHYRIMSADSDFR